MENIELVIKIPKDTYIATCNESMLPPDVKNVVNAIKNGTPLPKEHGKIISEPTEEDIAKTVGGQNDFAECIRDAVKAIFDNAPTIIEADALRYNAEQEKSEEER